MNKLLLMLVSVSLLLGSCYRYYHHPYDPPPPPHGHRDGHYDHRDYRDRGPDHDRRDRGSDYDNRDRNR